MAEVRPERRVTAHKPRREPEVEWPEPCVSCGEPEVRRYCPECGEKRVTEEDLSLRRFAGEAIHTFTNLESSVFRTFGALLARPGHLTAEYLAGRRRGYIRPLQLFIICNVLFFLVHPYLQLGMLTTPLFGHFRTFYGDLAWALVASRLEAGGTSGLEYAEEFNRAVLVQARSLVIVMVPIFAIFVYALYGRARRFFVEHLVFSLHFYAFFLLFAIGLVTIMLASLYLVTGVGSLSAARARMDDMEDISAIIAISTFYWYLTSASRRVYGGSLLINALKGAALAGSVVFVLILYRMILFFTTFYTT